MQLKISRVTDVADLKYLAKIEFASFAEDGGHIAMLGLNTPSSINATVERQKKEFTSDASNFWIKVFDTDANDRIVAASNWKIFPTYVQSEFEAKDKHINAMTPEHLSFMEDEKRQADGIIASKGFVSPALPRTPMLRACYILISPTDAPWNSLMELSQVNSRR